MSKYILDASSFLFLINHEDGYQLLEQEIPYSLMSVLSLLEIADVLSLASMPPNEIFEIISLLSHLLRGFLDFDLEQTIVSIKLSDMGDQRLSMGERASIGLSHMTGVPLLTGLPHLEINRQEEGR